MNKGRGGYMNYLNINLNNIERYRPYLYAKIIEKINLNAYSFNRFNLLEARDGEKIVEIKIDNRKVRLNSLYSPKREVERWLEQFDFNNLNVSVIMFGIANGIFAKLLLQSLRKNEVAIFYEPDMELFLYCITNFDMTDIICDIRAELYIKDINDENFYRGLQKIITAVMLPSQIVCVYPKFDEIYKSEIKKFNRDIKEKYKLELVLTYALKDYYKRNIGNVIKNLRFIENSNYNEEFTGKVPDDVPIIIVSSGPSLDNNIDELKRASGKAVILAVDTAVKHLLMHNIKFDAIVTIDSDVTIEMLIGNCEDIEKKNFKYPIFAGIGASNDVLKNSCGKKIWMINSEFMAKLYKKYNLKYSEWTIGGSVSTDAFKLAEKLGAKKIILVGQDLAFGDRATHAGGEKDYQEYLNEDISYVEDINGKKIKTRSDWLRFLYWFNSEIVTLDNIQVIDATEGGAKIEGTKIMKLSEAIDKYCRYEFDFSSVLEHMTKTFSKQTYIMVKKDMLGMREELKKIRERAKIGLNLAESIIYLLENEESNSNKEIYYTQKIKEINEYIEDCLVYSIIRSYTETKINGIMEVNCFSGNVKEDMIKSFQLSKNAFKAIIDVAREIQPIMEETLGKL